jgi:hypothetical protein
MGGYKPKITFWYTDDKELECLLQIRDFRKSEYMRKTENETIVEFEHYILQAFKTERILMSKRAIKCTKIIITKSLHSKLTRDDILDFFNPMLMLDLVGCQYVEEIEFMIDEDGKFLGYELYTVN